MHPGQRIGKYVVGERIAVGGMAEVWAARAEGPQGFVKPVALKLILESFSGDPELEALFVKEARIAAQLQHANLVSVFDFDKVAAEPERGLASRYYIAMEHVEGHDARRVAQAAKHAGYVFPLPLALYLGGEVLKGLRYVHERREAGRSLGLVHRDVSPHNVLVGFSGEVKLSDFGIAKSLAHSSRTKTGTIRGKICYASPEQLNGEPVDHRTDQFAMGITLWEILAGRPLFDGHNELEIIGQVLRCEIPPLALVSPERGVPSPVEAVIRKMLAAKRAERYPTTADALAALLALPGYTGDGAGLGDLVRTLFHRAGDLSSTLPMQDPAAQAQLREKPTAPRGGGAVAPAGREAGGVGEAEKKLPSLVATKTLDRPRPGAAVAAARRSSRPPAPRGATGPTQELRPAGKRGRWMTVSMVAAGAAAAAVVAGVVLTRQPAPREPREPPPVTAAPAAPSDVVRQPPVRAGAGAAAPIAAAPSVAPAPAAVAPRSSSAVLPPVTFGDPARAPQAPPPPPSSEGAPLASPPASSPAPRSERSRASEKGPANSAPIVE